jgi:hypothetical protein
MDPLEQRYREWFGRQGPHPDHLRQLTSRVVNEVGRQRRLGSVERRLPPGLMPSWSRIAYASMGAAVVLAMGLLYVALTGTSLLTRLQSSLATRIALMGGRDVRFVQQIEEFLADRVRWAAESGGDLSIGVDLRSGATVDASTPMIGRVVIVAREEGQPSWKPVWRTDVLFRGGEMVEITPNPGTANLLGIWAHGLNGTRIAINTSLSMQVPVQFSSKISRIIQNGAPTEIESFRQGNTEYRVYQVLRTLRDESQSG